MTRLQLCHMNMCKWTRKCQLRTVIKTISMAQPEEMLLHLLPCVSVMPSLACSLCSINITTLKFYHCSRWHLKKAKRLLEPIGIPFLMPYHQCESNHRNQCECVFVLVEFVRQFHNSAVTTYIKSCTMQSQNKKVSYFSLHVSIYGGCWGPTARDGLTP